MSVISDSLIQDVMQVCRHGHVVTDRMRSCPEQSRSHCDRCGTTTLHACPTCGGELPGAVAVPGLEPIGICKPPSFCSRCGAAFPWSCPRTGGACVSGLTTLEIFLRRLPRSIRQLRQRWSTRRPLLVEDEHDLEDLVRALLPLHFDDIRLQSRTPSYATDTRTNFLIPEQGIVCIAKMTSLTLRQAGLEKQISEDQEFCRSLPACRHLCIWIYDPQRCLIEPHAMERVWTQPETAPELHCIISG